MINGIRKQELDKKDNIIDLKIRLITLKYHLNQSNFQIDIKMISLSYHSQ